MDKSTFRNMLPTAFLLGLFSLVIPTFCEWQPTEENPEPYVLIRWTPNYAPQIRAEPVDDCWSACQFPGFDASKERCEAFDKCWPLMKEEARLRARTGEDFACRSACDEPVHDLSQYKDKKDYQDATRGDWTTYVECWPDAMMNEYGVPEKVLYMYYDRQKGGRQLHRTLELYKAEEGL
ncbi:hypothetical protein BJ508DRAFT_323127 [Ascobolus immersus RN42]|uniref:Apple domain-containing protein n=1 Tax=Ascobolus immersus RN42 TaxID=1160509 RepID=A0A3N4IFL3_ASCIM|nr:hypothetical protein BJ508DRAFT_323127 [Ascobolus immersus RN42]